VTILLSVLSVTLVYCGQTVGWIRMPLSTEVCLGPGDIVLDGDPAPATQRGTATPNFRAMTWPEKLVGLLGGIPPYQAAP